MPVNSCQSLVVVLIQENKKNVRYLIFQTLTNVCQLTLVRTAGHVLTPLAVTTVIAQAFGRENIAKQVRACLFRF